ATEPAAHVAVATRAHIRAPGHQQDVVVGEGEFHAAIAAGRGKWGPRELYQRRFPTPALGRGQPPEVAGRGLLRLSGPGGRAGGGRWDGLAAGVGRAGWGARAGAAPFCGRYGRGGRST